MAIFDAKLFRCLQGVLRKNARAIEIIKAVASVKPTPNNSIMRHSVADHIIEFFARMATLCGLVCNDNALGWYRHCAEVYCETIGMGKAVRPNLIGNAFDMLIPGQSATIEAGCQQNAADDND